VTSDAGGLAHALAGMTEGFATMREPGDVRMVADGHRLFIAIAEVDRFLQLRRRLGYTHANALMAALSKRVVTVIAGAEIGRIGRTSIEFAFGARDMAAAERQLEIVSRELERRITIDGIELSLQIVIGAADLGGNAIGEEAVDAAAAAVLDARRSHRGVVIASGAGGHVVPIDELALLRDLPAAMESGALQLHYQPKLRARTNTIDSAEGLLRWHHPEIGAVPIESFIRLAEETGAIGRLTEWAIGRAVADQFALKAAGHDLTLYVNISGQLLPDAGFAARALELAEWSGGKIGVEITETAVIGDPERAMANLARFTAAGIRIAIDDYGSGLSSLAYLKQLPAQELKIDRLFIKELINSHRDPLLVRSSIDLAHALEMEVTAEGVDDPVALALLRIMGCDLIQGYLVSPAVPVAALRDVVADTERLAGLSAPAAMAWQASGA
jgi:EAL domain-containing protein (putative c-di-GMP-specific phosphodiesterase class I)/GGDEF domain-containing protein